MGFFGKDRRDEELNEELHAYLTMAARDRMDRGESPQQAQQSARRELGNELLVREVTRDTWGWTRLEGLLKDLTCAVHGRSDDQKPRVPQDFLDWLDGQMG
jgi:hypothetical protein